MNPGAVGDALPTVVSETALDFQFPEPEEWYPGPPPVRGS